MVQRIDEWLQTQDFDPALRIRFRGANEEQAESMAFVQVAFLLSLALMFILLVTQFNSFYQSFLILLAVISVPWLLLPRPLILWQRHKKEMKQLEHAQTTVVSDGSALVPFSCSHIGSWHWAPPCTAHSPPARRPDGSCIGRMLLLSQLK